jgi:hypothetical protein
MPRVDVEVGPPLQLEPYRPHSLGIAVVIYEKSCRLLATRALAISAEIYGRREAGTQPHSPCPQYRILAGAVRLGFLNWILWTPSSQESDGSSVCCAIPEFESGYETVPKLERAATVARTNGLLEVFSIFNEEQKVAKGLRVKVV